MKGRNVNKLFSKNSLGSDSRRLSTSNTISSSTSIQSYIWLPALKKRNASRGIIREVLSPLEAKGRFASGERGVDPLGHAAAKIVIEVNYSDIELIETLQEQAILSQAVSLKDSKKINSLHAYLSWYPNRDQSLNDRFSPLEESEWLSGVSTGDKMVDAGKMSGLNFFKQKYSAINGNYTSDVSTYGEPDFIHNFTQGLDFSKIAKACFQLMKPVVRDNIIIMDTALPTAAYYGKIMLDEHRLAVSLLSNQSDEFTQVITEPEHVCTTANLFLFKAALGKYRYYEIIKEVFRENPEFAHGFPLTDLTHAFLKTLSKRPDFKNFISTNNGEDDTIKEDSNFKNKS